MKHVFNNHVKTKAAAHWILKEIEIGLGISELHHVPPPLKKVNKCSRLFNGDAYSNLIQQRNNRCLCPAICESSIYMYLIVSFFVCTRAKCTQTLCESQLHKRYWNEV